MSTVDEAFKALLYGQGAWVALILLIILIVGVAYTRRTIGVLMVPITILLGIEYLNNKLGWHAMIMFLTCVFIIFHLAKSK